MPLYCSLTYSNKVSPTTFPKPSNCVPINVRAGLGGGEGNCNHSSFVGFFLCVFTDFVAVLSLWSVS